MPPGRRGHRGMRHAQATMAGVLNSTAASDEEARRQILKTFLPALVLVLIGDVGCGWAIMWISCQTTRTTSSSSSSSSSTASVQHCLVGELRQGLHFRVGSSAGLGDLFWLALIRCFATMLLLWMGVNYGRYHQKESSQGSTSSAEEEEEDALTEPLLSTISSSSPATTTSSSNISEDDQVAESLEGQAPLRLQSHQRRRFCRLEPTTARNAVLVALFVASTAYQLYAGLKVSLYHPPPPHHHYQTPLTTTIVIVLMCLTILWINAGAGIFRILLAELTREKGLFLPVHRHPVFLENSRSLALHWCDLCHQRILPQQQVGVGGGAGGGGCYRCALCDFDVCRKCAHRADAATVGENLLRSDRGVRSEVALDQTSYMQRSLQVARSEMPLLVLSLTLLAASSMAKLLLPHFQGTIIDKVIPSASTGDYDTAGFAHYIRLYVYLMLGQGALATLYSAIFTLVSRRLKFTIRNKLLERILSQDVAYFDGTESGRLISRLTNDLDLMMVRASAVYVHVSGVL